MIGMKYRKHYRCQKEIDVKMILNNRAIKIVAIKY